MSYFQEIGRRLNEYFYVKEINRWMTPPYGQSFFLDAERKLSKQLLQGRLIEKLQRTRELAKH